tara:strand:+ start:130281 stop:131630 length:1350 start_codon:yes stop_codon:yes gene_type:complete
MSNSLPPPSLDQVLDLILDAVCVVDRDGRFLYVSAASRQVFGYAPEEMVGRMVWDLVHPEDQELTRAQAERVMSGISSSQIENRYIRKDGSVADIMWSARWSERDQVRIGVARDVTRRKQAERAQAALLEISRSVHRSGDLSALLDEIRGIIVELVPCDNFQVVLDHANPDSPAGSATPLNRAPEGVPSRHRLEPFVVQVMRTQRPLLLDRQSILAQGTKDADSLPHSWLGIPLVDDQGIMGVLTVERLLPQSAFSERERTLLQFVSEQVASAIRHRTMLLRLEHLAQYDALTGLPNRALLNDRLIQSLESAQRHDQLVALLFVDMDDFKQINDTLGHAAGDRLLQLAAQRLTACVRRADTVARLGGDEFVVVIEGLNSTAPLEGLMIKIREEFARPFELAGQIVGASLSVGLALYPRDGISPEALLQHADRGMYAAKADTRRNEGGSR